MQPSGAQALDATPALGPQRAAAKLVNGPHRVGSGGCSSAGRAPGCGPGGRGFKSRHSPQSRRPGRLAGSFALVWLCCGAWEEAAGGGAASEVPRHWAHHQADGFRRRLGGCARGLRVFCVGLAVLRGLGGGRRGWPTVPGSDWRAWIYRIRQAPATTRRTAVVRPCRQ